MKGRWFRPVALVGAVLVIALAVFFLLRGSWWMSATLIILWLGAEWWGVWRDQRRRRSRT